MDSKYFVTDDTALAAYLLLCGMKFIEATIWSSENHRKKYIIFDTPERPDHEEDFFLRKTTVAPMDYHDARVTVSRFLRREISDPRFNDL
jgi:hypothetical protein